MCFSFLFCGLIVLFRRLSFRRCALVIYVPSFSVFDVGTCVFLVVDGVSGVADLLHSNGGPDSTVMVRGCCGGHDNGCCCEVVVVCDESEMIGCGGDVLTWRCWMWRRQYVVDVVCDWLLTVRDSLTAFKSVEICWILFLVPVDSQIC
ncbi:hypothetical protein TSUD_176260 [Trifolium subterraneum]|uniref:Uncharacterized protein n=1 Tax=Trifolium subterraneum TaxID=3900 RepID=A0A2Z6PH87_TRISU|nr:hypothetical protein TSUD_176260 [Trifolium subterraneum]